MLRLGIGLLVFACVSGLGFFGWNYTTQNSNTADRWFGGYVDVTATPPYDFESRVSSAYRNMVLSFLVSHEGSCAPSWGGYYTLGEAADQLDLDRRVTRAVENGREIVLSFGGLLNDSLATRCESPEQLANAISSAIDRYHSYVIDFDIEGDELSNAESRARRVAATKLLQDRYTDEEKTLGVWLTLPADREGLTDEGIATVREFIDAGVTLSGVNLMVMNFGVPTSESSQADLSVAGLQAAHTQLRNLYWFAGQFYSDEQVWRRMGATPMIGQNDLVGEIFTLRDAGALHSFSETVGLGRISLWSLNRDDACDVNYPNHAAVATFCSGIAQSRGEFAEILSAGLTGGAAAFAIDSEIDLPQPGAVVEDDPATSPYPIWEERRAYAAETKVVWNGNVYAARWWTRGEQPDLPVAEGSSSWRLIGPVLPGDRPIPQPTLPPDFYAAWQADTVYHAGDRVMHEGEPYEAKWWTQGESPDAGNGDPGSSPWHPLSTEEISMLLDNEGDNDNGDDG